MYSRFKYIVGEVPGMYSDLMCAVVFPETVGHDDMAKAFVPGSIIGAGFGHVDGYSKEDPFPVLYGESTSLGIKSSDTDVKHVRRALAMTETNS